MVLRQTEGMSAGSEVVVGQTDRPRVGVGAMVLTVALTVLLTCALVASVLAAMLSTFFILYSGWPRYGVLNLATLVLVLAWAPLVVTVVVASRRRRQQWWTAGRLAIATMAVVVVSAAAWVGLLSY